MKIATNEKLLNNSTAVVTGGAKGIGGGISLALAEAGAKVLIVDKHRDWTENAVLEIQNGGGQAQAFIGDICTNETVTKMSETALQFGDGKVDILVNNVGDYFSAGLFSDSDERDWENLYNINLLHVFRCSRALLPTMLQHEQGSIINVSSIEAFRGIPANVVYSAFKAAVSQFTRSLAVEVAGQGVRVNCIAPDVTQTPQLPYDEWVPKEQECLIPSWVPVGRFGQPEDHGKVAVFLASEQSSFVTGHTIPVDGGTLAASGWYKREGEQSWTNRPLKP